MRDERIGLCVIKCVSGKRSSEMEEKGGGNVLTESRCIEKNTSWARKQNPGGEKYGKKA